MKAVYNTDHNTAYQTLEIEINATPEEIFYYIGTTDGIRQWFPELTFEDEPKPDMLLFDLGDGYIESMDVEEYYEPRHIGFTWDVGYVKIDLAGGGDGQTLLTLNERLPFEFESIARDFTGWYFQVQNIKHISETGEPDSMDMDNFKKVEAEVEEKLKL